MSKTTILSWMIEQRFLYFFEFAFSKEGRKRATKMSGVVIPRDIVTALASSGIICAILTWGVGERFENGLWRVANLS